MGRIALPADVKAQQGTLRQCRENRTVLSVDGRLPEQPPVGLTKDARAAWTMAVSCAPKGLLTAVDHSVLERWARNYAMYRKLQKQVDKQGEVSADGMLVNPAFLALIKTQAVLAACEKELGFTPASRARVRVQKTEETEGNPFAEA